MWVAGSQASTHNDNARSCGTPPSAEARSQALRQSPFDMPLVPCQPATHRVTDGAGIAAFSASAARGLEPLAFAGFRTGREADAVWANAGGPKCQMQTVATHPAASNLKKPMAHPRTARCFVLLSLAVIGDTGIRDSPDISERNHSFEIDDAAMSGVAHFARSALRHRELRTGATRLFGLLNQKFGALRGYSSAGALPLHLCHVGCRIPVLHALLKPRPSPVLDLLLRVLAARLRRDCCFRPGRQGLATRWRAGLGIGGPTDAQQERAEVKGCAHGRQR